MSQAWRLPFVLPGIADEPTYPSGGNTYNRRVCEGLSDRGWQPRRIVVPGRWPHPDATALELLAGNLAAVADGRLVLLDGLVACAAPQVVVPQARRLRLVVLCHLPLGDEIGLPIAEAAELGEREARTLRAATAVITTSAAAARRLLARYDLPPARVHVAPPGVDVAPLAPGTPTGARLLCVAAVTPRKGYDVLVKALAAVSDLDWICVGAGPNRPDDPYPEVVGGLIEAHGLGHRFRLVGPQSPQRLAERYAATDVLVLPSRAEPFGMVVAEALARGIPVIASAVGGIPEALGRACGGRRPGLLVPPGDAAVLARALRRWLTEPALRRRLRLVARARRAALPGWDRATACVGAVLIRAGGGA